MSCPIKVNSNTVELTVHISCYCVLDILCVILNDSFHHSHSHSPSSKQDQSKALIVSFDKI